MAWQLEFYPHPRSYRKKNIKILSLAPKFNPPFDKKDFPINHLSADIETAITHSEDLDKIEFRNKLCNVAQIF